MSRRILYSFVFAAAVFFNTCEGGVPLYRKLAQRNQVPELKFLGYFVPTTSHSSTQASLYFISQNAAAWTTAENDCKAFLGPTGALVAIETEEELEAVNKYLKGSDDTRSEFWLGGTYDVGTSSFLWNNQVAVADWAPWGASEPATSVPVSRISGQAVGDLKFRSKFSTESYRYMCELPV